MAINAATLAASILSALDAALGAVTGGQAAARSSLASSIATPVANAHNADGGAGAIFVDAEVPSGTINGSNVTFTLAFTPTSGSLHLFLNGVRLRPTTDYAISVATITMVVAPDTGDWLYADYRR